MPPYAKDEVLTTGMAEAGFVIQDLLAGVELTSKQLGSSQVEKRKLPFDDIDFTIPGTNDTVTGNVEIEQYKSTYLHYFLIRVEFPVGERSVEKIYFGWGVDNPGRQTTNRMVQSFNEEGLLVASRTAKNEGFSTWDRQFIGTVLDRALDYKGAERGEA